MIKTFRGRLPDGGQDRIRLSTKTGKTGYRIIKFNLYMLSPGTVDQESTMRLWKVKQASVGVGSVEVDFADNNMLAVGSTMGWSDRQVSDTVVIFDQEVFNQDIYITHTETLAAIDCNYYLELETIPLTDNAAAVSTLRDIRLNPQVGG